MIQPRQNKTQQNPMHIHLIYCIAGLLGGKASWSVFSGQLLHGGDMSNSTCIWNYLDFDEFYEINRGDP